jgi:multidrug efflux pump subunit AcrB
MNISQFFISRPIFTTLTAVGILTFGTVAYRSLPVAALPSVDFPTLQVSASLDTARAPVLYHRRHRFDELLEFDRQHQHHNPVLA